MPGEITFDAEATTEPLILENGRAVGFVCDGEPFLYGYAMERPDAVDLIVAIREAGKRDPVCQRWLRLRQRRKS